jgi:hypothetical protein
MNIIRIIIVTLTNITFLYVKNLKLKLKCISKYIMSIVLQTDPTCLPLLNKYLSQIDVYFEYGCGTSTYLACNVDNIKKIYSVESDIFG